MYSPVPFFGVIMNEVKEINIIQQKEAEVKSLRNQLEDMQLKLDAMQEMVLMFRKTLMDKNKPSNEDEAAAVEVKEEDNAVYNKDGIPLNGAFIGYTQASPWPYILIVDNDGSYRVGNKTYASLSAAAEDVSGVRRSGWVFWELLDGRTLKEVYKK